MGGDRSGPLFPPRFQVFGSSLVLLITKVLTTRSSLASLRAASASPCLQALSPSEMHFKSILKLERIQRLPRCVKAKQRIQSRDCAGKRRLAKSRSREVALTNRIQVGHIHAVDNVKEIEGKFTGKALVKMDAARHPHVPAKDGGPLERVSAERSRPVVERVGVAICVETGKNVEKFATLSIQQCAEFEIVQQRNRVRHRAHQIKGEFLWYGLPGSGAFQVSIRGLRNIRQVGNGLIVRNRPRVRIAAMQAEPVTVSLLDFRCAAVINTHSAAIYHVEKRSQVREDCICRFLAGSSHNGNLNAQQIGTVDGGKACFGVAIVAGACHNGNTKASLTPIHRANLLRIQVAGNSALMDRVDVKIAY